MSAGQKSNIPLFQSVQFIPINAGVTAMQQVFQTATQL